MKIRLHLISMYRCILLYIFRRKILSYIKGFSYKYFEDTYYEKRVWVPSAKISNYMIMFTKPYVGEDNELGKNSFKDIILTYSESEMVPRIVTFWNNSVVACTKQSPLINAIKKLEKYGVKILVSANSLEMLDLKHSLRVGNLANHLDLIAAINKVQKVVTF